MFVPQFDDLLAWLRTSFQHGNCHYVDPTVSWCSVIRGQIQRDRRAPAKHVGVYIVWHHDSRGALYIGKGGTIDSTGRYKNQNLLQRLTNVRSRDVRADVHFAEIITAEGGIDVEYFILTPPWIPSFVEAALLQAYFNAQGRLPRLNKAF